MSSIGTGYDLTASQFSPDGRVFQVEYAIKAAENSGTAIGLRGRDGVVLAVERLVFSKLYEPRAQSNSRVFNIDKHIGMAIGGLLADARAMADYAREECSNFRSNYGISIPLHHLSDRIAAYMHAHTLLGSVRPFGCSLIFASYEALPQNKQPVPQLFMIDPSGLSNGYIGCAVGKSRQFAKTEIEKIKVQNLTCKELVNEAARIIYGAHEEAETREKPFELELSWVCEATGGRHELVPPAVLSAANDYAKARLREADAEDEEMPAAQ